MAANRNQKKEEKPKKNTQEFEQEVKGCFDREEFEKLIAEAEDEKLLRDWESKIKSMLAAGPNGEKITNERMAEAFGMGVNTVSAFHSRIPAKRRSVIMLAALLRLNMRQANALLLQAKYQRLYAKNPEDAIWIYILANGGTDQPKAMFDAYWAVYQRLRRQEKKKREGGSLVRMPTVTLEEQISAVRRPDGVLPAADVKFEAMMKQCMESSKDGYEKLVVFLEDQFTRLKESRLGMMTQEERDRLKENKKVTPNIVFAEDESYRNRYYNRLSNIKKNHEVPSRTFLISLGIRLAMDTDGINHMLELAGMAPMCAKDKLESALIFYLEELNLLFPHVFQKVAREGEDPEKTYRFCTLEDLNKLGENAPGLLMDRETEVPSERIMSYIKRCLEESSIFTQEERGFRTKKKMNGVEEVVLEKTDLTELLELL